MDPRRLTAIAVFLVAAATPARTQESPEQIAQRLKDLVDRKLAELRSELHQEIDAALKRRDRGVSFGPVSEEFRRLHRLPRTTGTMVTAVGWAGADWARDGSTLLVGDVIVSVGENPVGGLADFERMYPPEALYGRPPPVEVIRKGERRTVMFWPHWNRQPKPAPQETADQMLERLWDKALKDVVGAGGIQEITPKNHAPDSRPSEKFPIPPNGGRR